MRVGPIQIEVSESGRAVRLKDAVLASFHEPAPSIQARLQEFSARDWRRAKYWLDVSGLALYFFDRLQKLNLQNCLPEFLLRQLHTHLDENRQRTAALLEEAMKVTYALRDMRVECAILKGITFPPESVPDLSLRNQMDLDLLIRESDLKRTRDCLAEFGYSLHAASGGTHEFKAGPSGTSSIANLYQVRPEQCLEVHTDNNRPHESKTDRLTRSEWQMVRGYWLAALSPADIFVLQGQHLFKHMCGEYTRASWVLEFWRHVSARRDDVAFWREVECLAAEFPDCAIAIGAALLLTTLTFGPCVPRELACWSMDKLPARVCLWIQLYGRRVLLADKPGSKLYLLLRKELSRDSAADKLERRRLLLPFHRPQKVTRSVEGESVIARMHRAWIQTRFIKRRLRFHLLEGCALLIESARWQRRSGGVSR